MEDYTVSVLKTQFLRTLFICILLFGTANVIYAQHPGGVIGPNAWYLTTKVGNQYILRDSSGHKWPDLKVSKDTISINFHPAILFDGAQILNKEFVNTSFNQGSIASILYPDPSSYQQRNFISIGYNSKVIALKYNSIDNGTVKYSFGNPVKRNSYLLNNQTALSTSLKTVFYYKGTGKVYNSIWGEKRTFTLSTNFKGFVPELIIYNKVLTPLEMARVQSYLSIKYGTTLDSSYIGSDGRLLWSYQDVILRSFHNRIFAIGKDTRGALNQPIANTSYEEEPFNSFKYSSDHTKIEPPLVFIPKESGRALYRSVTIGFLDQTLKEIPEGSFLFLGDDAKSIKSAQFYKIDPDKYPSLIAVQRNWIVYNRDKIKHSTRLVVAGNDYLRTALFSNLYQPYDYQLYRFVIIKLRQLNPPLVDTLYLCDYFEREHLNYQKFNTRGIVWNNISWDNDGPNSYFTFGKVSILNFLQIGKKKDNLQTLHYPYYPKLPVLAKTQFDTLTMIYKDGEPLSAHFKVSEGVKPLTTKLYQIKNGTMLEEIKNSISMDTDIAPVLVDTSPTSIDETTDSSPELLPPPVSEKLVTIQRHTAVKYQKSVGFNVINLAYDQKYLIVVTDKLGQTTTIPIRISK